MSPTYRFHVNVFADPQEAFFACTWEDAAARLERLPRMIFEPDGSFVYSGNLERAGPSKRAGPAPPPPPANTARWQVDGHLFDFAGRLYRLELHGDCPASAFDELLRTVGWPQQSVQFELVQEGTTIDEAAFRRHAQQSE